MIYTAPADCIVRPMTNSLSLRGVCKSYQAGVAGCSGSVAVLRDVDLDVAPGELVAISSGAGAGKTTLLLCAAGMLRPDGGTIAWFGRVHREGVSPRPEGIAYACDRPFPYGFLTAREALEYSAVVRDLPMAQSATRVADVLERTGLAPFSDRRVDALDGAGLSRLSVATALLQQPRLLLIDDVSSGCNSTTAAELIGVLRWLAAQGAAVVVAGALTVWLRAADSISVSPATRFLHLVDGHLEADEEPRSRMRRPMTTQPVHARVAEDSPRPAAPELGAG
jgi:ABC-type multidrug transport system ATPase subunit